MSLTRPQLLRGAIFSVGMLVSGIAQVSLVNALPWPPLQLNVPVVVAMYGTLAWGWRLPLFWAVVVGLLQDLHAPVGFGVHAWSLVAAVTAVFLSAQQWVTDRTTLALLALGLAGSLVYRGTQLSASFAYQLVNHSVWTWRPPWGAFDFTTELLRVSLEMVVLAFISSVWGNPRWRRALVRRG